MVPKTLDKICQEIIEVLYRHPEGLGFNELWKQGGFNRVTLRRHLNRHLIPQFIEVAHGRQRKKVHKLTKKGVSIAFKARSQNYGKLARSKWAQKWLDEGWEPIDVTNLIVEAPKTDMVYLMRHRKKREAKLIVPLFLDGSIYLRFEGGGQLNLVPDVLSRTDVKMADRSVIVSKLEGFIRSNKVEAGLDPGPAYKRFLGTLREYVSTMRYIGGPIPFSKEIQSEVYINADLNKHILKCIMNPLKTGIYLSLIRNTATHQYYGFWVILNQNQQKLLTTILKDHVKSRRFRDIFVLRLKSFIQECLAEAMKT